MMEAVLSAFKTHFKTGNDGKEVLDEDEVPTSYEGEQRDFEAYKDEHDNAFIGYMRVSCFAHTLQLVVSKFSE